MTFDTKPDNFLNGGDNAASDPFAPLDADPAPRRAETAPEARTADPVEPRHPRRRRLWTAVFAVLLAALAVACWMRYFNPYVTDARVSGYITNVERRGLVFKTFEGDMISQQALTDTLRLYSRDFRFSVTDDSLARRLQDLQSTGRPVTLVYKRYYAPVPWRGASPAVVTEILNP